MKLRCRTNALSAFSAEEAQVIRRWKGSDVVNLRVGEEYIVLGLLVRDGSVWPLVHEEEWEEYPKAFHHGFFDVIDSRMPPWWRFHRSEGNGAPISFLPDEWCNDAMFWEKMLNGEKGAVASFLRVLQQTKDWDSAR